jgi:riboflavin synthase
MFTGLIESQATLVALERGNRPCLALRAALEPPPAVGASLAVNGVCLTLVERRGALLRFDLAEPTLRLSNLQDLAPGAPLNLERPLALGGRLDGHLVSGHIDGTVRLRAAQRGGGASRWSFTFREREWRRLLVVRGSVALNGVSLTLAEVHPTWFSVELIPQTLAATNLGRLRSGERVNIELDLLGKTLYNFYRTEKGRAR